MSLRNVWSLSLLSGWSPLKKSSPKGQRKADARPFYGWPSTDSSLHTFYNGVVQWILDVPSEARRPCCFQGSHICRTCAHSLWWGSCLLQRQTLPPPALALCPLFLGQQLTCLSFSLLKISVPVTPQLLGPVSHDFHLMPVSSCSVNLSISGKFSFIIPFNAGLCSVLCCLSLFQTVCYLLLLCYL